MGVSGKRDPEIAKQADIQERLAALGMECQAGELSEVARHLEVLEDMVEHLTAPALGLRS